MKRISALFQKYQTTIKPPQATVEKEVVLVVESVSGVKLELAQVQYSPASRLVTLQVPSVVRTEVVRHQKEILSRLRGVLGVANAPHQLR